MTTDPNPPTTGDTVEVSLDGLTRTINELRAERDRLREALEEVCVCETCSGSGVFQPECEACLSGIGTCTCRQTPNEKCPQCEGSGRDYRGSAKARAVLEGGR